MLIYNLYSKAVDKMELRERITMIVTYDMLKTNISLSNQGGRICKVGFKESGWCREQVFTSEDLPDIIPYELIGLVKSQDGAVWPKYKAKVVTRNKLYLSGKIGLKNGIEIMNRICHELCYQDGFFDAKSIKRSDLQSLGDEKLSYWIASQSTDGIMSVENLGEDIPVYGASPCSSNSMIFSHNLYDDTAFPIRPTIVLKIKVNIGKGNIPFVSL